MGKGRCKKVMVGIGKAILAEITVPGMRAIQSITQTVASTDWSSKEKRDRALEMSKATLKNLGVEARESSIRATQEMMVVGLKKVGDKMQDVAQMDDDEPDIILGGLEADEA